MIMSAEIGISPEQIPVNNDRLATPIVACMGSTACKRVCQMQCDGLTLISADPTSALPFESQCTVLDDITKVDMVPDVVNELLSAVTMPELKSLHGDELVQEAHDYLTHLISRGEVFSTYVQSLLRGNSQPRFARLSAERAFNEQTYTSNYTPETAEDKEELLTFHAVLRGFYDLHSLRETGLLFDEAIEAMFKQAASEIGVGHHIKLVGEPGIAKTTFAKYLALQNAKAHHPDIEDEELTPTVISFSSTSEAESQLSEQTFQEGTLGSQLGKIGKAMKEGRGVVLDEQNGMTADQQTYFNDLFLKKPGMPVTIEGETFMVAEGFCVIATLNPMTDTQGNRRHGRQQQDSANAARFSRLDFKYPYQKGYRGNSAETISRIFFAHHVDNYGWQLPSTDTANLLVDISELMKNLTVMATEPTKDGTTTSITASQARPDMAECISPRDLGRILELGFGYDDVASAPKAVRAQIYDKVQQVLNSDNGHFISIKTKEAAQALLVAGKFHA